LFGAIMARFIESRQVLRRMAPTSDNLGSQHIGA
jgi:hypothetical protein